MAMPITIANALSAFSITLALGVSMLNFDHGMSRDACVEDGCGDGGLQEGDVNFTGDLPSEWRVVTADANARGWKMMGFAKCSLVDVESEVSRVMAGHGMSMTHRVDDEGDGRNVLIEFASKNGMRIMWMLWRQSVSETGFSWGISK